MIKGLTYRKKCYAIAGAFVTFFYVTYKISFSETYALSKQIGENQEKLSWLKEKEKELPALKLKMQEFEGGYLKNDTLSVRDMLTAYISDYAENNRCTVTEIPGNSFYTNNNLKVQTNSFTIKGNYYNLLKLLNKLENDHKYISKIMSARFYALKDHQSKKINLYLNIATQSFEQKN